MATNGYLERKKVREQAIFDTGERIGMQKMWDYVQLALRNPEVMKKDVFGRGRIEAIYNDVKRLSNEYHIAFTSDVEADYMQEKLDAYLREIWGEDLEDFYSRYPELKRYSYTKPPKEWSK